MARPSRLPWASVCAVKRRRIAIPAAARVLFVSATIAMGLAACGSSPTPVAKAATTASSSSAPVTTITLQSPISYTPHAPAGGTDDYHCTLVNPHVTSDSMIVYSDFYPNDGNSFEVHHAILFLVPPSLAKEAEADDGNNEGWTCFGESPLPGNLVRPGLEHALAHGLGAGARRGQRPEGDRCPLSGRQPGHHAGPLQPARGRQPGASQPGPAHRARLEHLTPLRLDLLPAPPDIPCPAGITGPLCDRAASLADVGQRFGAERDPVRQLPAAVLLREHG